MSSLGQLPQLAGTGAGEAVQGKIPSCLDSPSGGISETQYLILWEDLAYARKPVTSISDSKSMGPSSLGEREQPACTPWHFCDIF